MAERDGRDWGQPGEMKDAAISPVIGDLERRTPPQGSEMPGGTGAQALLDLDYPLARDDLVRAAAGKRAPGELLDILARLPNRVYRSAADVAGEMARTPAGRPGIMR